MMRRFTLALCALLALAATGTPLGTPELRANGRRDCTDSCAEGAARDCGRIDSLRCDWYIYKCLVVCGWSQIAVD